MLDVSDYSESDLDLQELAACPGLYKEIPVRRTPINNKTALENALSQIRRDLPWVERMDVVTKPAPAAKELDVPDNSDEIDPDDDFKRENYFYRIAQAAVLVAIPKLHGLQVPTKRPVDYFAEMVKSDEHMGKIKQHLFETQERLALRERSKQIREKRRFGKETQQAILQERRTKKRQLTEAIKASRKKSGKSREELLDQILSSFPNESTDNKEKGGFHRAKDIANRRKLNHKRDFKNKKYGHGGQKKRGKRNTTESFGGGRTGREFDPIKHQVTPRRAKRLQVEQRKSYKKLKQRNQNRKKFKSK